MVARDSAEDADKVGRGLTTPILGFDELAYLKNIHITLPVANLQQMPQERKLLNQML